MDREERCADCFCLTEKEGRPFCDELQDYCTDIEVCPEWEHDDSKATETIF